MNPVAHGTAALGLLATLMLSRSVAGQSAAADSVSAAIVGADFADPTAPTDWRRYRHVGSCEAALTRALRISAFDEERVHPGAWGTVVTDRWTPLPTSAIAVGRQCLEHIPTRGESVFDLPLLLRLAIAVNNDTLVDTVVMRQRHEAGASERKQAAVFEAAVHALMTNAWEVAGQSINFLTPAHVRLARRYTAAMQHMGPDALVYRVRSTIWLNKALQHDAGDFDTQMATAREFLQFMRQVPRSAVPPGDRSEIDNTIGSEEMQLAWLQYAHTGSHEDLARYLTVQDSVKVASGWEKADSVVGRPAAPITGDYWFNTPAGWRASTVPTPGVVSMVEFVIPREGAGASGISPADIANMRRLHAQYPQLQIILVALTSGSLGGQSMFDHPEQEAALIHTFLRDSLGFPGIIGVIKRDFRAVSGGNLLPVSNPVLDGYHIDPRAGGQVFLIDAQGWVVKDLGVSAEEDSMLLKTLLSKAATP